VQTVVHSDDQPPYDQVFWSETPSSAVKCVVNLVTFSWVIIHGIRVGIVVDTPVATVPTNGSGVYYATLNPTPNGSISEYAVEALDATGHGSWSTDVKTGQLLRTADFVSSGWSTISGRPAWIPGGPPGVTLGSAVGATDIVSQQITVPAETASHVASSGLAFYCYATINTTDFPYAPFDVLYAYLYDANSGAFLAGQALCSNQDASGYVAGYFPHSSLAGRTINVEIVSVNDDSFLTTFTLDSPEFDYQLYYNPGFNS
jgi:hypothetical protein